MKVKNLIKDSSKKAVTFFKDLLSELKEITPFLGMIVIVLLVISLIGLLIGAAISGTISDNQKRKNWESISDVEEQTDGLSVLKFTYKGHEYLSFRQILPGVSFEGSVVHNPECPCTKK